MADVLPGHHRLAQRREGHRCTLPRYSCTREHLTPWTRQSRPDMQPPSANYPETDSGSSQRRLQPSEGCCSAKEISNEPIMTRHDTLSHLRVQAHDVAEPQERVLLLDAVLQVPQRRAPRPYEVLQVGADRLGARPRHLRRSVGRVSDLGLEGQGITACHQLGRGRCMRGQGRRARLHSTQWAGLSPSVTGPCVRHSRQCS